MILFHWLSWLALLWSLLRREYNSEVCIKLLLRSCDGMILFHRLSWICLIKNHSLRAYSKWMDLRALHDIFRFQHCIVVAKINWTQQLWIGNQFMNTKECRSISLDLIMIMLILYWLLILLLEIIYVPTFSSSMCGFFYSISQNYIQCFAFLLVNYFIFSALHMYSISQIDFNGLHKDSLHQT